MQFLFTKQEKQFRLANDNTHHKEIKIHKLICSENFWIALKTFTQVVKHYQKVFAYHIYVKVKILS